MTTETLGAEIFDLDWKLRFLRQRNENQDTKLSPTVYAHYEHAVELFDRISTGLRNCMANGSASIREWQAALEITLSYAQQEISWIERHGEIQIPPAR